MAGRTRRAFDLTVRSAQKELEGEYRLNPSVDAVLIASGRNIADTIDHAVSQAEIVAKEADDLRDPDDIAWAVRRGVAAEKSVEKAMYLTPHLLNVVREMYSTPKSRVDAARETAKVAAAAKEKDPPATSGTPKGRMQGLKGGKAS